MCARREVAGRISRPNFAFYPLNAPWPPADAKMRFHFATDAIGAALDYRDDPPPSIEDVEIDYPPLD